MVAFITKLKDSVVKHHIRSTISIVVLIVIIFFGWNFFSGSNKQPRYQTAIVTRSTLVVSLAESGQIVSTGNLPFTTQASGVVHAVLVKNGTTVMKGQEIMDVTPDQNSIEAETQALVDYNTAINSKISATAQLEKDRQAVLDAQGTVDQMNAIIGGTKNNPKTGSPYTQNEINSTNSTLISSRESFSADEKKYLNVDNSIAVAAQALQDLSTKVVAPDSGVISNITFAPGMAITGGTQTVTTGTGGSSASTNSRSASTIARI